MVLLLDSRPVHRATELQVWRGGAIDWRHKGGGDGTREGGTIDWRFTAQKKWRAAIVARISNLGPMHHYQPSTPSHVVRELLACPASMSGVPGAH